MILLDTHVLLWVDQNSPRLGASARRLVMSALTSDAVAVSAITFWEVAMLVAKRRLPTSVELTRWRQDVLNSGVLELPLNGVTGILATQLDALHGDPADRMIVATAIGHSATLVTADARLLAWTGSMERCDASQ